MFIAVMYRVSPSKAEPGYSPAHAMRVPEAMSATTRCRISSRRSGGWARPYRKRCNVNRAFPAEPRRSPQTARLTSGRHRHRSCGPRSRSGLLENSFNILVPLPQGSSAVCGRSHPGSRIDQVPAGAELHCSHRYVPSLQRYRFSKKAILCWDSRVDTASRVAPNHRGGRSREAPAMSSSREWRGSFRSWVQAQEIAFGVGNAQ